MAENGPLLTDVVDGICTLTINRPRQRNSLSPELLVELTKIMGGVRSNSTVRVFVIRGAGEQAFSAGYDIGAIGSAAEPEARARSERILRDAVASVEQCPRAVIAMVHGYCLGAAFELASACDLRILSENAQVGIPAAKLGVIYHPDGIRRVINLIGLGNAKELFLTGRRFNAHKAQSIGWATEVVVDAELDAFVGTLAREVAENAPLSISGTKSIISKILRAPAISEQDVAQIESLMQGYAASEDYAEARRAFALKQKPRFVGR